MCVILSLSKIFEAIITEILFYRKEIIFLGALTLIFSCDSVKFICVAFLTEVWTSISWSANFRFFRDSPFFHFRIATKACDIFWIILKTTFMTSYCLSCLYFLFLLFLIFFIVIIKTFNQEFSTFFTFDII